MENLPPEALPEVAAYFQALSEPTRLQLLNILRDGERNVGELAQLCGTTAANVSRHLSLLTKHGMVSRESRGTSVYYSIADPSAFQGLLPRRPGELWQGGFKPEAGPTC